MPTESEYLGATTDEESHRLATRFALRESKASAASEAAKASEDAIILDFQKKGD